jgi:photosystem II stability/assembly factor-like uncharacterized protein
MTDRAIGGEAVSSEARNGGRRSPGTCGSRRAALKGVAACFLLLAGSAIAAQPVLHIVPAELTPYATQTAAMAVTLAGNRLVSVGAQGVILLSDDAGRHFRQAREVPIASTLTAVSFADPKHGWAVGNWGAILRTEDGGETWQLQRSDLHADIPLFGVYFRTVRQGWATGLWSLLLATDDGGANWRLIKPPAEHGADRTGLNFNAIFPAGANTLLIPAEQGKVLLSADNGATWKVIDTGYTGSFWSGLALRDGAILLGGLRGSIYRSTDGGLTWRRVPSEGRSSVTGFTQLADGSIAASALDGVMLRSTDDGLSFTATQRPDRAELTAVISGDGRNLVFMSADGPTAPQLPVQGAEPLHQASR